MARLVTVVCIKLKPLSRLKNRTCKLLNLALESHNNLVFNWIEMSKNRIEVALGLIKAEFLDEPTGHDYWHIVRVHGMAKRLAEEEGADVLVTEMAAIFHDYADHKLFSEAECQKRYAFLREWLKEHDVSDEQVDHIMFIIENSSYSKSKKSGIELSIEGKIVQDADRIEAIGAIGIARAFAYGGAKGRPIFDQPGLPEDVEALPEGSTIHHFYEKLLLLKDTLQTASAQKIAEQRHQFMEDFLSQFYMEWEAKP